MKRRRYPRSRFDHAVGSWRGNNPLA